MNNNFEKNQNSAYASNEKEIDLSIILRFFLRNKILITTISFVFFSLFCIFAIFQKRTWEGQFQIVLNSEESLVDSITNSNILNNQALSLFSTGRAPSNLKTEVGILESPLVLMPIFEYVNSELTKINNESPYPDFFTWKNDNLTINLKKGTSILKIVYQDKNKDIIIPVLEKISSEYQIYSGRNKKRGLFLTKTYLENQIDFFKLKSSRSIKKAQEYAIDQDLTMLDIQNSAEVRNNLLNINSNKEKTSNGIISNIGIEGVRVQAVNEINRINSKIKKIEELGNDIDQLQYISLTIPELVNQGLPEQINELDIKILEARSKYKVNDPIVKRLENMKNDLTMVLKSSSLGMLRAQKIVAEAKMEAASRPKGVVLRYKELMREAGRDENTLISLENAFRRVNLEEKRTEDPWELITKPTLKKFPVAPKRKEIGLYGLVLGFIIGSLLAILREKNSGLVFEKKYLEEIFGKKVLDQLNTDELISNSPNNLILNGILNANKENRIKIIELGINYDDNFESFKIKSKKLYKKIEFINQPYSDIDDQIIILITSIGKLKSKDLNILKKSLDLNNKQLNSIFILN